MTDAVTIFEVGPRDGLQNEKKHVATSDKVKLNNMLSDCGFKKIEATSFVSKKWVPQMADAEQVMHNIERRKGISYAALTPNMQGYEAAKKGSVDEVAIFAAATETFSQKNLNCSIADSIERFLPIMEAASKDKTPVRGYISCVTDCPYEGTVSPEKVAEIAALLIEIGCYEVSLGDTIGQGTPESIGNMLNAVLTKTGPEKLAGHYHDTNGMALDNIKLSLALGIRTFDASVGGLGGCPYAPGAAGNVATEAVVAMAENLGLATGIDLVKLEKVAAFAKNLRS